MVTDLITGAVVSNLTVLVTVVLFPALSVAVIVIVLVPLASVNTLLNDPSDSTVTDSAVPLFSLIVTVTGLLVTSLVTPFTVSDAVLVTNPSTGEDILSVGGTVSILNVILLVDAAFPS